MIITDAKTLKDKLTDGCRGNTHICYICGDPLNLAKEAFVSYLTTDRVIISNHAYCYAKCAIPKKSNVL